MVRSYFIFPFIALMLVVTACNSETSANNNESPKVVKMEVAPHETAPAKKETTSKKTTPVTKEVAVKKATAAKERTTATPAAAKATPVEQEVTTTKAAPAKKEVAPKKEAPIQKAKTPESFYKNVDAKMFNSLLGKRDMVVIDVRTPREFAGGHIKGARNINISSFSFGSEVKKLDNSKTYLIYCLTGSRSRSAMRKMKSMGISRIYNLQRGVREWMGAGYKLER